MKFRELPIKNIRDVEDKDAFLICNVIDHDTEDVNNINKSLIHISNFAHKEAINSVVEQNSKLVEFIQKLITKCNDLEREVNEIKQSINNQSTNSSYKDIINVNNEINLIKKRLDENLIES